MIGLCRWSVGDDRMVIWSDDASKRFGVWKRYSVDFAALEISQISCHSSEKMKVASVSAKQLTVTVCRFYEHRVTVLVAFWRNFLLDANENQFVG